MIGPAAEAVVTVTLASRKSRMIGPRSVSTVCTRDSGAMRCSRESHPVWENTRSPVTSQRVRR
ncbi:hypothetical protein BJF80_14465 [Serinicoccus sp. CUA-874]|nr:hypothetical protein BJF80_14465 [Serinicoccus sp. CUA-874]